MNGLYCLDSSRNAEIRSAWYQLCISAGISCRALTVVTHVTCHTGLLHPNYVDMGDIPCARELVLLLWVQVTQL